MRVLLDITSIPRRPAGAGRYALELAQALAKQVADDELIILDRWKHASERLGIDSLTPRSRVRFLRVSLPSRAQRLIWEQTVLPVLARTLQVDLLHSTHHSLPWLPVHCVQAVTVHDLNFLTLPERYPPLRRTYMAQMTRRAVSRAGAVIVPSQAVAADLVKLLHVPPARLHVVNEAAACRFRPQSAAAIDAVRKRYGLHASYLLSVGTLEPGKNRLGLLRAFASLRQAGYPHQLVFIGQPGWRQGRLGEAVRRLDLEGAVLFLGYVDDCDLPALYAGAGLFVFPSWAEGFGLPPVEAMACGTVVVASSRPALPEVLGDAALYAAPDSPGALASAMRRLLDDPALCDNLRRAGLGRAASYSWERAARETWSVYRALVEKRG